MFVLTAVSSINTEVAPIKKALLTNPSSASASHVGSLALSRPQAFFHGYAMASEKADVHCGFPEFAACEEPKQFHPA